MVLGTPYHRNTLRATDNRLPFVTSGRVLSGLPVEQYMADPTLIMHTVDGVEHISVLLPINVNLDLMRTYVCDVRTGTLIQIPFTGLLGDPDTVILGQSSELDKLEGDNLAHVRAQALDLSQAAIGALINLPTNIKRRQGIPVEEQQAS